MQLSQTAEYALRAVVRLAEVGGVPQTTSQIADGCHIPAGYLAKVLQPLVKAGIVSAQRGFGGGYALESDAGSLTLLQVISAVEPVQRLVACPLKLASHCARLCALHRALDDAMAAFERELGKHTIKALLEADADIRPLCESDDRAFRTRLAQPGSGNGHANRADATNGSTPPAPGTRGGA